MPGWLGVHQVRIAWAKLYRPEASAGSRTKATAAPASTSAGAAALSGGHRPPERLLFELLPTIRDLQRKAVPPAPGTSRAMGHRSSSACSLTRGSNVVVPAPRMWSAAANV